MKVGTFMMPLHPPAAAVPAATGIHLLDLAIGVLGAADRVCASVEAARRPARERGHAGVEYAPAGNVIANLQAIDDAASQRAPCPVSLEEMIAKFSAVEAIFRSA